MAKELYVEDERGEEQNHEVKNRLVLFDGRVPHGTRPLKGTRYAVILYAIGDASYQQTPALARAFLEQVGYQLPSVAFKEEPSREHWWLAKRAAAGLKVGARSQLDRNARWRTKRRGMSPPRARGRQRRPSQGRRARERRRGMWISSSFLILTEACGPKVDVLQPPKAPAAAPAKWSDDDLAFLKRAKEPKRRWSWGAIATKLRRTEAEVRLKHYELQEIERAAARGSEKSGGTMFTGVYRLLSGSRRGFRRHIQLRGGSAGHTGGLESSANLMSP